MSELANLNASSVSSNTEIDPYATISLPENSLLDAATLTQFKQTAREINLPVQTLEKWLKKEEIRLQQWAENQKQEKQSQQDAWIQECREKWGTQLEQEINRAARAADVFGGEELRTLLEETGLGNHPVIIRTLAGVGKRMEEDVAVVGTTQVSTDKTFTQALYGKK